MTNEIDQLSETFAAHEHLAPDAEAVLANANGIARSYLRRRLAMRATGGAVLGAGLVAGGVALPGRIGHSNPTQKLGSFGAADGGDPSPSAPAYTQAQELAAYFDAGYLYDDAVRLAQLWHESSGDANITNVKAEAGLKLLNGVDLPIQPSGTAVPPEQTKKDQAVNAFFAAGYTYDDAVQLSKMWHDGGSYQAKVDGGQKLLDGQSLPIPPSGSASSDGSQPMTPTAARAKSLLAQKEARKRVFLITSKGAATGQATPSSGMDPATAAYFAAGYDYQNAVALGKLWNETDIGQIKTEAGQKLLDGQTLPVKPSQQPEKALDKARAAFFNAGYTYDDAVTLGNMWHESDTWQVKADAGQKLLDGQKLPIAP